MRLLFSKDLEISLHILNDTFLLNIRYEALDFYLQLNKMKLNSKNNNALFHNMLFLIYCKLLFQVL